MRKYKIHRECYKFYKDNVKKKVVSAGISEDLFMALKELYQNVDFVEVSDRATKNNKLLFGEDDITFVDYYYKRFKSTELNPCFNREKLNIEIKTSKVMIKENVFRNCVDLKLTSRISKKSVAKVRYKLLINYINYRHIKRFINIYKMSRELEFSI